MNYNPNKHPRSQDLQEFMALNFAINIVTTKFMRDKGRIVGKSFFSKIKLSENIDIDDKWQFIIGNLIINKKINFLNLK